MLTFSCDICKIKKQKRSLIFEILITVLGALLAHLEFTWGAEGEENLEGFKHLNCDHAIRDAFYHSMSVTSSFEKSNKTQNEMKEYIASKLTCIVCFNYGRAIEASYLARDTVQQMAGVYIPIR